MTPACWQIRRKARDVESGCQGVEPSTEWLNTKLSEVIADPVTWARSATC